MAGDPPGHGGRARDARMLNNGCLAASLDLAVCPTAAATSIRP